MNQYFADPASNSVYFLRVNTAGEAMKYELYREGLIAAAQDYPVSLSGEASVSDDYIRLDSTWKGFSNTLTWTPLTPNDAPSRKAVKTKKKHFAAYLDNYGTREQVLGKPTPKATVYRNLGIALALFLIGLVLVACVEHYASGKILTLVLTVACALPVAIFAGGFIVDAVVNNMSVMSRRQNVRLRFAVYGGLIAATLVLGSMMGGRIFG